MIRFYFNRYLLYLISRARIQGDLYESIFQRIIIANEINGICLEIRNFASISFIAFQQKDCILQYLSSGIIYILCFKYYILLIIQNSVPFITYKVKLERSILCDISIQRIQNQNMSYKLFFLRVKKSSIITVSNRFSTIINTLETGQLYYILFDKVLLFQVFIIFDFSILAQPAYETNHKSGMSRLAFGIQFNFSRTYSVQTSVALWLCNISLGAKVRLLSPYR